MRLKEIRLSKGYTQEAMSEKMGISRGTYSLWEIEFDTIPLKRLNDFCDVCDVSIDYALGYTSKPQYKAHKQDIDPKKTGMRLKEVRKEKHLTQNNIGDALDVDRSLLSKYEQAKALVSTPFLMKYMEMFSVSGDYLLGEIDEKVKLEMN